MDGQQYLDAALVLVGHGSTLDKDSGAPAYFQAAQMRQRQIFAEVKVGFWKQEPNLLTVVQQCCQKRVFIVPLFISEGYFSEAIIPRALGFEGAKNARLVRRQVRHGQILYYRRPVGTHENMTRVILARADEVVKRHPFPRAPAWQDMALCVAGHGTTKNENSRLAIDCQVERIRNLRRYAEVHGIFLEEAPRISDCYQLTRVNNLIVVPFFISDGLHAKQDIPVLLGESERAVSARLQQSLPPWRNPTEMKGKRLWYASSMGMDNQLAEVIMARVNEDAA